MAKNMVHRSSINGILKFPWVGLMTPVLMSTSLVFHVVGVGINIEPKMELC